MLSQSRVGLALMVLTLFISCQIKLSQADDNYFIVRNPYSGLVLDASEHQVKLQHFTGTSNQQWKAEPAPLGRGRMFIINKKTGKVLDAAEYYVVTNSKHGGLTQQWYLNSDGTITNGLRPGHGLDIRRENYQAGTNIIIYVKRASNNQWFEFQYL